MGVPPILDETSLMIMMSIWMPSHVAIFRDAIHPASDGGKHGAMKKKR
jgi:hypothetical protein